MLYRLPIPEWLLFLLIHAAVPLFGIVAYIWLCRRLHLHGESPAVFALLFPLFCCWGGVLLVTLTALFWYWSGMASLGTFFLLLVSPFIFLPATIGLRRITRHPAVSEGAWYSCVLYYIVVGTALVLFIGPWGKR
ncbi:MAG: hypothetical protein H0X73_05440 [Chthoniobacterales bacterium]|nr:hypothetical protein [Chthoniobacterales bacterium]